MVYKDSLGYPVDQTYDGGDSAVRNSILWAAKDDRAAGLFTYFNNGSPVRHPVNPPHNNPKNMTRDNLIMLLGAVAHNPTQTYRDESKKVLLKLLKRFCFCFNTERDYPGTKKYPWPHIMKGGDQKDNGKPRLFDAPDFLFPNHMWVAMSAAGVWWRWLLYPICLVFHLLFLIGHTLGNHNEENQMFFECLSFKTIYIYAKFNWKWKQRNCIYWQDRNEIDYHFMMEDMVEGLT